MERGVGEAAAGGGRRERVEALEAAGGAEYRVQYNTIRQGKTKIACSSPSMLLSSRISTGPL